MWSSFWRRSKPVPKASSRGGYVVSPSGKWTRIVSGQAATAFGLEPGVWHVHWDGDDYPHHVYVWLKDNGKVDVCFPGLDLKVVGGL